MRRCNLRRYGGAWTWASGHGQGLPLQTGLVRGEDGRIKSWLGLARVPLWPLSQPSPHPPRAFPAFPTFPPTAKMRRETTEKSIRRVHNVKAVADKLGLLTKPQLSHLQILSRVSDQQLPRLAIDLEAHLGTVHGRGDGQLVKLHAAGGQGQRHCKRPAAALVLLVRRVALAQTNILVRNGNRSFPPWPALGRYIK